MSSRQPCVEETKRASAYQLLQHLHASVVSTQHNEAIVFGVTNGERHYVARSATGLPKDGACGTMGVRSYVADPFATDMSQLKSAGVFKTPTPSSCTYQSGCLCNERCR